MWTLQHKITLNDKTINSPNLATKFSNDDLEKISQRVWEGYNNDKSSREGWEKRMSAAMELAMQINRAKNFPWPNCSNIAFPLVTIAALQFHSRAYPALVNGSNIVRCKIYGDDPDFKLKEIADRITKHMSWQLLEEDEDWEEEHDKLLLVLPILGCAFKKSYYSALLGHNISELVLPQDLVIDYSAKSVDSARRKTHIIPMYRNDIYERVMQGLYLDILEDGWFKSHPTLQAPSQMEMGRDRREGISQSESDFSTPFRILEQHCFLDLDGDGYEEPYIVTIEESSHKLLRIVSRFTTSSIHRLDNGRIANIRAEEYFTKYPFIPSPDGGIYDIGFGCLLGPLNESVNSIVNQLVDAGTMSNTGGGFLGRGVTVRGGNYSFSPNEWKRVDSPGDDLKKNIFPLPVREPSNVLFQLLGFIVDYTNRVSASTELMSGENVGQNTKTGTVQTMQENGMKIYNAIYKRIWKGMKKEFKKLFVLNAINLPEKQSISPGMIALRQDYLTNPDHIIPAADPYITSDMMKIQQASAIRQAAYTVPGYNREAVERNWLRALQVDGESIFYPGPDKVQPLPNPKVQVEQMKMQGKQVAAQMHLQETIIKLQAQQGETQAKIDLLEAQASATIAGIGAERAKQELEALRTAVEALKTKHQITQDYIQLAQQGIQNAHERDMGRMEAASRDKGGD